MSDLPKGYEVQIRDAASVRRRMDRGKGGTGGTWRAVRTDKPRWQGPWRHLWHWAAADAAKHASRRRWG